MRLNRILTFLLFVVLISGCGSGGGSSTPPANSGGGSGTGSFGSSGGASNVLAITVNDPSYPNKPTVSVTVCAPGSTTNCQTINNILLDTGDYGLRIFKQTPLNVSLQQIMVGSGSLAECVTYADGSGDWGPVQIADVVLGGETASNVPIQVIDATYFASAIPAACKPPNVTSLDQSPSSAGFNGSLGVGLFASDCGPGCSSANNGTYYTCSGSSCVGTGVSPTSQVQNPVALLRQDNNGVIVQLPSVPLGERHRQAASLSLGSAPGPTIHLPGRHHILPTITENLLQFSTVQPFLTVSSTAAPTDFFSTPRQASCPFAPAGIAHHPHYL